MKYNVRFGFNIDFDNIPSIAQKPIVGVLNDLAGKVSGLRK